MQSAGAGEDTDTEEEYLDAENSPEFDYGYLETRLNTLEGTRNADQDKNKRELKNIKKDLTSSIDKLSTSVTSLENNYEAQGVINKQMVDVLRQLNQQNMEQEGKLNKIKKTPFGAFI